MTDHIEYLTSEHDCVIVPGWGAFIAQYTSAQENEIGESIIKPERKLGFNPSLDYNDGLLANSIMRKEGVSYEEANTIIEECVKALKQQLSHEGEVPFGRLGFFQSQGDGRTSGFIPFKSACRYNNFFGLSSLNIKTLESLNDTSKAFEEDKNETRNKRLYIPINWNSIQIAASIIVLFVLTFVLTTPIAKQNATDYASMNAFKVIDGKAPKSSNLELNIALPKQSEQSTVKAECHEVEKKDVKCEESISKQEKTNEQQKPIKDNIQKAESYKVPENSFNEGNCYLIVASLASKELAEKYISSASNSNLRILEVDGKYRVYSASGNYNDVKSVKSHSKQSDSWIYRMN